MTETSSFPFVFGEKIITALEQDSFVLHCIVAWLQVYDEHGPAASDIVARYLLV